MLLEPRIFIEDSSAMIERHSFSIFPVESFRPHSQLLGSCNTGFIWHAVSWTVQHQVDARALAAPAHWRDPLVDPIEITKPAVGVKEVAQIAWLKHKVEAERHMKRPFAFVYDSVQPDDVTHVVGVMDVLDDNVLVVVDVDVDLYR